MNEAEFQEELAKCRNVLDGVKSEIRAARDAELRGVSTERLFHAMAKCSNLAAALEHLEYAATGVVQRQVDEAKGKTSCPI